MRIALPIISRASPMLLLYRSLDCASAVATKGTTHGAASVSRSSWQMTSSRLQTMLWNALLVWMGQPVVPNGIPLSKIHHAAFDAHLIGIDPDYRLHVSDRLLMQKDGPMLQALKRLNGGTIHRPKRDKDQPDRDRLALRFERFRALA
jgi:hypothetical protein